MHHVLVVDDDPQFCRLVQNTLKGEGYEVEAAHDLASSLCALNNRRPDLAIVDVTLGPESGLDLVRELQKYPETGVIIMSGKGDTVDRVVGLEVGADDYITKPFDPRELLARVRSNIRRSARLSDSIAASSKQPSTILFEGWRLERTRRKLQSPAGEEITLTTVEFELLSTLAEYAGSPVSRDQLFQAATGNENRSVYDRSVDIHIANLRKKIETDPANPEIIKSIRGVGYTMAAEVEPG